MNLSPREMFDLLPGALPEGELRAWIVDAMRAYQHGLPLEHAMGLAGARARAARDAALCAAAAIVAPDDEIPAQARILALHIEHFEARILPVVNRRPDRPLNGWKLELHRAFRTGCTIPKSSKHLAEILREKLPGG